MKTPSRRRSGNAYDLNLNIYKEGKGGQEMMPVAVDQAELTRHSFPH